MITKTTSFDTIINKHESTDLSAQDVIKFTNNLDNIKLIKKNVYSDRLIKRSYDDAFLSQSIQLPEVPKRKLQSGIIVNDYSNDHYFATRMTTMSLATAKQIKQLVNDHPHEYPMPCMAITAISIKKSIIEIRNQFSLTPEEDNLFNELELELKQLFPLYPYKESLIIAYKWAFYKSFLEYKFQLNDYQPPKKMIDIIAGFKNIDDLVISNHDLLNYEMGIHFAGNLGINRVSFFKNNCTLAKINGLPWSKLLNNTTDFKKELLNIYFSLLYYRQVYKYDDSAFNALNSGEVLIPYTKELSVEFLNKAWCLSLWLVGYAVDQECINADGFNMSSNSFMEHDLYHLAVKLVEINDKSIIFNKLFNVIRLMYQNSYLIDKTNFLHLEFVLFYILHEKGILFTDYSSQQTSTDIMSALEQIVITYDEARARDLPVKYADLNRSGIKKACYFLKQIFNSDYSEYELVKKIAHGIVPDNNSKLTGEVNKATSEQHISITVDYGSCKYIDEIISYIKHNKEIFQQYDINSSNLIGIFRLYYKELIGLYRGKTISFKTLKQAKIDEKILSTIDINSKKEKKVVLSVLRRNDSFTDATSWKLACAEVATKIKECSALQLSRYLKS